MKKGNSVYHVVSPFPSAPSQYMRNCEDSFDKQKTERENPTPNGCRKGQFQAWKGPTLEWP